MSDKGAVFIDTAGWLALMHRGDNLHAQTMESYRSMGNLRRVTTDAVLIESCNAFSKASLRPLAIALMNKVAEAKALGILEVVHVDEALIARGLELFKGRMDKDWSLTDCISFEAMLQMKIKTVLTSDRHFEQAGFEKLLYIEEA